MQNFAVGYELGKRSPIILQATSELHNSKLGNPKILKFYPSIPKVFVHNFASRHIG